MLLLSQEKALYNIDKNSLKVIELQLVNEEEHKNGSWEKILV